MSSNPYAAPAARVADDPNAAAPPPIWNPNAAASWSLLFSPAFGSYLHMLNWRALGDEKKAAAQKAWFIVSLVFLGVSIALGVAAINGWRAGEVVSRGIGLGVLLGWYFGTARAQARYVKEQFGKDYPRKPWGKALGIALGLAIVYMALSVVCGIAFSPREAP